MNEFTVTINNKKHFIKLNNSIQAEVNGKKNYVELSLVNDNACLLKYGSKVFEVTLDRIANNHFGFLIDGWYFDTFVRTPLQETASDIRNKKGLSQKVLEVRAPMPCLIHKLFKNSGDEIKKGEPLLIFEAMKMENELRSTSDGIIKEVFVKVGETVEKNSLLLIIE